MFLSRYGAQSSLECLSYYRLEYPIYAYLLSIESNSKRDNLTPEILRLQIKKMIL